MLHAQLSTPISERPAVPATALPFSGQARKVGIATILQICKSGSDSRGWSCDSEVDSRRFGIIFHATYLNHTTYHENHATLLFEKGVTPALTSENLLTSVGSGRLRLPESLQPYSKE